MSVPSTATRLAAMLLAGLTMAAADDGCNADKSLGGNDPSDEPVACGAVTCLSLIHI